MRRIFHPDYGTIRVEEEGYLGNRRRAVVVVNRTLGMVWVFAGETWKALIRVASPTALALFALEIVETLKHLRFSVRYIQVPVSMDNVRWRVPGKLPR